MKPLRNNILIELLEQTKTSSGLIVHDADKKLEIAKIIDIGPEVKKLKKGQKIATKTYNMDTVNVGGVDHHFVNEDDVLATCK